MKFLVVITLLIVNIIPPPPSSCFYACCSTHDMMTIQYHTICSFHYYLTRNYSTPLLTATTNPKPTLKYSRIFRVIAFATLFIATSVRLHVVHDELFDESNHFASPILMVDWVEELTLQRKLTRPLPQLLLVRNDA